MGWLHSYCLLFWAVLWTRPRHCWSVAWAELGWAVLNCQGDNRTSSLPVPRTCLVCTETSVGLIYWYREANRYRTLQRKYIYTIKINFRNNVIYLYVKILNQYSLVQKDLGMFCIALFWLTSLSGKIMCQNNLFKVSEEGLHWFKPGLSENKQAQ